MADANGRTPVAGKPVPSFAVQDRVDRVLMKSWISFLLAFLQLGCAISLICIVRYNLEWITYATFPNLLPNTVVWNYQCLLSTDTGAWACQYAYALGAISILLSIVIFVMQCVAIGDAPHTGARITEVFLDVFGAAWWLAGAIVLTNENNTANKLPQSSSRAGVLAMSWISFGLFLILLVVNTALVVKMRKARRPEGAERKDVTGMQMAV